VIYILAIPPMSTLLGMPPSASPGDSLHQISRQAHVYGMASINAFNATDLRMAENWFTIHLVRKDGSTERLEVFDEEGGRLAMHRSDRVYFGHTLRFRRNVIGTQECEHATHYELIRTLASSYSFKGESFLYRQFQQPLPDTGRIRDGLFALEPVGLICEVEFEMAGPEQQ
jgi:hypothetical protein